MQASLQELYQMLLDGEKVTLQLPDFKASENLRVSLVKRNAEFVAVGISSGSLLADWNSYNNQATYWIGKPRRQSAGLFEIVSHEKIPEQQISHDIQRIVGEDSDEYGTCEGNLYSADSTASDPSNQEAQVQDQRPA